MKLKKGVQVRKGDISVNIRVVDAMLQVAVLYERLGITGLRAYITSILDGRHMKGSLHYDGKAFDIRTWNKEMNGQMTDKEKRVLARMVQDLLGDDFDVVVEKTHIHIEYQPL